MNILFLCRGNVARSQMAASLFQEFSDNGDKYTVKSAGTKLSEPEASIKSLRPKTNNVIESMQEIDVDISKKTREEVTPEMISWADKVFLVLNSKKDPIPEFVTDHSDVTVWETQDVKGRSIDFTRQVRDEINKSKKSC
ncbi:MAG: hypothetical protein BRC25_03365 [Parcubacteria group bacterium SW_6_46_9]|nr:MAG: hypothetical protein BRC25_03365 [Parcubacteria group bacterium SW_6_46_9]